LKIQNSEFRIIKTAKNAKFYARGAKQMIILTSNFKHLPALLKEGFVLVLI